MTVFEFLMDFKETPPKKKMRLPKKFVRLFGETLSDVALLKPTVGLTWEIGLTKTDGKVWLNNSWPKFVKRFGLDKGRSLFFRYERDSEFSVSIFDNSKSISQIYCGNNPDVTSSDEIDDEVKGIGRRGSSGNPIEISGSFSLSCPNDDVSLPQCTSTRANSRNKEKTPMNSLSNDDSVGSNSESVDFRKLGSRGKLRGSVKKARKRTRSPRPNANNKALPRDGRNPSFTILIRRTNVDRSFSMDLPMAFWREYLNSRTGDVVLYSSEGRVWRVKLSIVIASRKNPQPNISGRPWKKFVLDNSLAVGDSCTFELVNRTYISFNVAISRAPNDSSSDSSDTENSAPTQGRAKSRQSPPEKIESEQEFWKLGSEDYVADQDCTETCSKKPSFRVNVRKLPYYYQKVLGSFGVHLEQKTHTVLLEVGERLWPVKVLFCKSGHYLSRGYLVFLQQNCLSQGDQCEYELKDGNKGILKVTIFRSKNTL